MLGVALAALSGCGQDRSESKGKLGTWLSAQGMSVTVSSPDPAGQMTLGIRNDGDQPLAFRFLLEGWFGGRSLKAFDGKDMGPLAGEPLGKGQIMEIVLAEGLFLSTAGPPVALGSSTLGKPERVRVTLRARGTERAYVFEP
jgi:hypothetical protein